MAPEILDLTIQQGSIFEFSYRWVVARVPQSLAGAVVRFGVAPRPGAPLVIDLSSERGEIQVEPNRETGRIKFNISSQDTAKLRRAHRYDLVVIKSPSEAHRVLQGKILVDRSVTPTTIEV